MCNNAVDSELTKESHLLRTRGCSVSWREDILDVSEILVGNGKELRTPEQDYDDYQDQKLADEEWYNDEEMMASDPDEY